MLDIAAIGIEVDTSGVRRGSQDLQKLGEQAGKAADRTIATEMAFDRLSRQMARFNGLAGVAVGYFGVTALTGYARELVRVADAYSSVNSRLQVATGSTLEAAQAQEKLFAVAQKTRASFTETADLFAKLTTSTKSLGVSQDRLVGITETVNKAITLSGASAQASQAALVQFGQGLASGTLRGEELNSILEQTPALAKALADGLGVPVGSLRKLGEEGKITSDRIIEAFEKVRDSVDRDFAKVATTVDSAFTVLKNSFGKAVSEADKTTGATSAISTAILELSADIDSFVSSPEFGEYLGNIKIAFVGIGEAIGGATRAIGSLVQFAADNQGTLKFLAELAVGLRTASAGAAAGAAIGSAVPVVGTAAGAAIGAGVGYLGGVQGVSSASDAITGDAAIRKREELRKETERLTAKEAEYQKRLETAGSGSRLFYQKALTGIQADLAKATKESSIVENELQNRFLAGVAIQSKSASATQSTIAPVKTLTEEQKKAAESYDKLIAGIKAKTAEASLELSGDKALSSAQKEALKITMDLATGKVQYTDSQKRAITAALEENIAVERALELQKAYQQAQREALDARQKVLDEAYKGIDAIIKEREQIEEQIEAVGKSKSELEALRAAKLDDAVATLEQKIAMESFGDANDDLILAYRKQIDEIRKLQTARRSLSDRQASQEITDRQSKAFEDLYKDLSRGLTDSIFRGFEGGKKFITSFKDAIRNAFKSFIVKFAVQPVLGSVIGGIASTFGFSGLAQAASRELGSFGGIGGASGGAAGSSGGGFGLADAGGAKTLYDAFAGGIAGISGAVTNGINNLGAYLATSNNNLAASVGDYIVSGSTNAGGGLAGAGGSAAGFAASAGIAYGGYQLGRGIGNGYSLNGGTGNGAVNTGAAIGAAIGSIVPVVGTAIGAAAGAVFGGLVNRAFGSKTTTSLGASGIEGTFGNGGFSGSTFQDVFVTTKKGLLRGGGSSTSTFTQYGQIPFEALEQLSESFDALTESAKASGLILGRNLTASLNAVRVSGRFSIGTQDEFKATLDRLSDEIIRQTIPAVEQFRASGENLVQTAGRIATATATANNAAIILGQSAQFGIDNAAAALSLQASLGDQANQLESVLSQFVPAAVLARRQLEVFRTSLRNLGLESRITTDITREQFATLLEQIDLTSEAGQRELETLLSIAPALSQVIASRDAEKAAIEQSQKTIEQSQKTLDRMIESISGTTNAFEDADDAINATRLALFNTEDATARLQLESQLGQQIAARYELEMQLLGALQSGLSELAVNVGGERGQTQGAIAEILGTPLLRNAAQISTAVADAAKSANLPSLSGIESATASLDAVTRLAGTISDGRKIADELNKATTGKVGQLTYLEGTFGLNASGRIGESKDKPGSGLNFVELGQKYSINGGAATTLGAGNLQYRSNPGQAFNNDVINELIVMRNSESISKIGEIISRAVDFNKALDDIVKNPALAFAGGKFGNVDDLLKKASDNVNEQKKIFSDAIQEFVIDAGKAVNKLSKLREETVAYFQAQKALADLYNSSATQLRNTVAGVRFNKLTESEQLSQLRGQFDTAVLLSKSLTGDALVSQADKINSLIDPLLQLAFQLTPNGDTFTRLEASILSQAEDVASRLEDLAPKNFQEESVKLLGQIDTQLSLIEENTATAEKLIVDAINISRDRTLEGLRGVVAAVRGEDVPAFASGGMFAGGMRLVGERGPELEVTGPSRIFSASQTRSILSGSGNSEMAAEIRALRQEVSQLRAENRAGHAAVAANTGKAARVLERADNGDGLNITMVTE